MRANINNSKYYLQKLVSLMLKNYQLQYLKLIVEIMTITKKSRARFGICKALITAARKREKSKLITQTLQKIRHQAFINGNIGKFMLLKRSTFQGELMTFDKRFLYNLHPNNYCQAKKNDLESSVPMISLDSICFHYFFVSYNFFIVSLTQSFSFLAQFIKIIPITIAPVHKLRQLKPYP